MKPFCLLSFLLFSLLAFAGTPRVVAKGHPFYDLEQTLHKQELKPKQYKDLCRIEPLDSEEQCFRKLFLLLLCQKKFLENGIFEFGVENARLAYEKYPDSAAIVSISARIEARDAANYSDKIKAIWMLIPFLPESENVPCIVRTMRTVFDYVLLNKKSSGYDVFFKFVGDGNLDKGIARSEILRTYWTSLIDLEYIDVKSEEDVLVARKEMTAEKKQEAVKIWEGLRKKIEEQSSEIREEIKSQRMAVISMKQAQAQAAREKVIRNRMAMGITGIVVLTVAVIFLDLGYWRVAKNR